MIKPGTSASAQCTVSGTVRRLGPASIITASSGGNAAGIGNEFGLAGKGEAHLRQLGLGYRAGDHTACFAGDCEMRGSLQRIESEMRAEHFRLARIVGAVGLAEHGQRIGEAR